MLRLALSATLLRFASDSADALKIQRRRQHREREAHTQSLPCEPTSDSAWHELSPLLDEAITRLGRADRDALVLRYFENKSLREIGSALGTNEEAAKKRVARGVEKLRTFFARRGVAHSTAVIVTAISVNSVQAAPPGTALMISTIVVKGSMVTASTLTLVKAEP